MQGNQLIRFALVGSVGFMIDAGVMSLLMYSGIHYIFARPLAFAPAVAATWLLNRLWTFSQTDRSRPGRQFWIYAAIQVFGASVNFLVFIVVMQFMVPTQKNIFFALFAGSSFGLFVNYLCAKMLGSGLIAKRSR